MSQHTVPNGRLQAAASTFATHGLSVIPIGSLEAKSPGLESWKPYTVTAASKDEATHWFIANGRPAATGLGLVCGAVSGGLTVIDFDTTATGDTLYDAWCALVSELTPGLLDTLPVVLTPSGGFHVYFRCAVVEGNTKLAESARHETWIETRGEGGYVLAPPTPGYEQLARRISGTPTITMAERALLLNAARSLSAKPPTAPRLPDDCSPLPGDAFNAGATVGSVVGMLTAHGWTVVRDGTEAATVRRPGKDQGISATVRLCNGTPVTYAFSTNAGNLPSGVGLSPFAVYTHLNHCGDYSQAARALVGPVVPKAPRVAPTGPTGPTVEPFDYRVFIKKGNDLLDKVFAPIDWVVDGVIPSGLTLIAGSPKAGKSLFGWNIALAAATGGVALGNVQVKQRPVFYIMLEDGERLAQKRMRRMLSPGARVPGLEYAQGWRNLSEGGTEDIAHFCANNPGALVVIDTYESLRGRGTDGMDSYRNDYRALKPLHDVVKEHDYNVLIIHHTNKRHSEDPFAAINGSNGLSGVADTLGILRRGEDPESAVLYLRGRDLDADITYALDFDPASGCHRLLGEQDTVGKNPGQHVIVTFLRGLGKDASPAEIARGVDRPNDNALLKLLARMVDGGTLLKSAWGRYSLYIEPANLTNMTGSFPTRNRDCESPITVENEPVMSAGLGPTEAPTEAPTGAPTHFSGVPIALQAVPCAGCGKKFNKVFAPSGDGSLWCRNCGVACPTA